MPWYADLHVHSRHSRATSRQGDVRHMALWARYKGLGLVGTGDFTHPGWREELKRDLVPAEPGLYQPTPAVQAWVDAELPSTCRGPIRFVLQAEISTIYKADETTRKVHHVVFAPSLEAADRLSERLGSIGNITSDGRPILGLDSRDLLELVLESDPLSFLVPAHIWTPWFAALGSRSGFDSIDACYRDLAPAIFAVETGLSSSPAMNWRVASLDRFRLISCSDAHSPGKLARNATMLEASLDYPGLRRALASGEGYHGTVEFWPEEGKYHLDGHRACGVCLEPAQTRALEGLCPVCGKPLTVGVLHRVEVLADRPAGSSIRPATAGAVRTFIPLPEILAETMGVGAQSQRVQRTWLELLARLGPELEILGERPLAEIGRQGGSLLAEAVERMRAGEVIRQGGYDGEYGRVRLFDDHELQQLLRGGLLFTPPARPPEEEAPKPAPHARPKPASPLRPPERTAAPDGGLLAALDPDQRAVAEVVQGPLLVVAGPGAGKTRTLTHRVAHLVRERGLPPEACLVVTFTRRAARELRERLAALLGEEAAKVPVHTFHSLGLMLLREHGALLDLPEGFRVASEAERIAALREHTRLSEAKARRLLPALSRARRDGSLSALEEATPGLAAALAASRGVGLLDLDELVALPAALLQAYEELRRACWSRWPQISVDEYQDIDATQHRLLRLLLPPEEPGLCAIGDPDQAIYGFRGSDVAFFERFPVDFPGARLLRLARNYRSGRPIVEAAVEVVTHAEPRLRPVRILREQPERVVLHAAPTEAAEAEFVVHTLEQLLGGHSFFSLDSRRSQDGLHADLSFGDIAVLYRTEAQAEPLVEALARSGMPFQRRSHAPLREQPGVPEILGALSEGLDLPAAVATALATFPALRPALEAAEEALAPLASRCGRDLARFRAEVDLGLQVDTWDPRAERIALLTLHAAKGLEFAVVFIVGLEDGILPLRFGPAPLEPGALEEERRLLYVGMTRAKERLFLCHARKRTWRGKRQKQGPSPFLGDIRRQLLEHRESLAPKGPRDPGHEQMKLF
ncbi:MAG: UvrD-helicase domain-containing protein [Pseudomonadota bacterium]